MLLLALSLEWCPDRHKAEADWDPTIARSSDEHLKHERDVNHALEGSHSTILQVFPFPVIFNSEYGYSLPRTYSY